MQKGEENRREDAYGVSTAIKLGMFAALISCGLYIVCGCDTKKDDRWIFLEGTVVQREDHSPIDSAWVVLIDSMRSPTYTDSSGHFVLMMVPYAQLDIYAGKAGYLTTHRLIETHEKDVSEILIGLEKANGQNEGGQ